ncbi:MAG TPA: leucyl/phenylalanyl-tRNA--protein transferase [Gammaproteobacteria bacterium]
MTKPDGLLAVGGDLAPERILNAYRHGIFPWFSPGQPILWWSPDPRAVLFPEKLKVSRSLRKTIDRHTYRVTFDTAFEQVIRACAQTPRRGQDGTWISEEMQQAYIKLHEMGYAHSAESWLGDELVGGLYGLRLGRIFFGESMFSRKTDASKVPFVHLVRKLQAEGVVLIDCQVTTEHLLSLGAEEITRTRFIEMVARYSTLPVDRTN